MSILPYLWLGTPSLPFPMEAVLAIHVEGEGGYIIGY